MSLKFHILKESGRLNKYSSEIQKICKEAETKVSAILPVTNVDIVILDNPYETIPEKGMGGHTYTSHIVVISIDPLFPELARTLKQELSDTLAHELHHAARWQAIGYGETLSEAIVSEGLADHFARQIRQNEYIQPWDKALTPEQVEELLTKAKEEFDSKTYNHTAWFFGSEEKKIPRWTAYTIGYQLVDKYLKNHTDQTAGSLYRTIAGKFL